MNLTEIGCVNLKKAGREDLLRTHDTLHLISKNVNTKDKIVCNRLLILHTLLAKEMKNRSIDHNNKEILLKQEVDGIHSPPTMADVEGFGFEWALSMGEEELERMHQIIHSVFWDENLDNKETLIKLHDIAVREMVNRGIPHGEWSYMQMPEQIIKSGDVEPLLLSKPYPNEHSARIKNPGGYIRLRRKNDYFKSGIDVIWGITKENKTEVQAIRFDKGEYTVAEAKAWLKKNNFKSIDFEPAKEEKSKGANSFPLFKVDKKKRIVYGVVMEPDTVDTDGEFIKAEEIEKAYYKFVEDPDTHFDIQHDDGRTIDKDVRVVEMYLAPADFTIEKSQEKIRKGSWIMGLKILKEGIWEDIENGKLTGYSIQGHGYAKL